jgi:hypothetical protein
MVAADKARLTCIANDTNYLPFLASADEPEILDWFRLKPLLAYLVAERSSVVVAVAALRDAGPGPGAGDPSGRWLEACHLATAPPPRPGPPSPTDPSSTPSLASA